MKTYTTFELELDDLYQIRWSGGCLFHVYKNGDKVDTFEDYMCHHVQHTVEQLQQDAKESALGYLRDALIIEDIHDYL